MTVGDGMHRDDAPVSRTGRDQLITGILVLDTAKLTTAIDLAF